MTEEEKYRRKTGLLRRAIRIAEELDQAETTEAGSAEAPAAAEKTTAREAEDNR